MTMVYYTLLSDRFPFILFLFLENYQSKLIIESKLLTIFVFNDKIQAYKKRTL
jgi:hypothetical protein